MLLQTSSTHQVTLPKLMSLYLQVAKKKKSLALKFLSDIDYQKNAKTKWMKKITRRNNLRLSVDA